MYEETAYDEGPKSTPPLLPEEMQKQTMGSVLWAQTGFQRILVKDKWGQVQGEKEISLTGFLSCTTDSMEIGGRDRRWAGRWMCDKRWKKRQTTNAFHL